MKLYPLLLLMILLTACGNSKKKASTADAARVAIDFSADSAYQFCERQCQFGPRTMNSDAHEQCGEWIASQFRHYGLDVQLQRADLKGYDGTLLKSTNIIASYRPELADRILLCAHWDSRPWADNDPDEQNWRTPVTAANDGASGVAVMLEVARLLALTRNEPADSSDHTSQFPRLNPQLGIDLICFDAEDWGTPQWSEAEPEENPWALGAQHWVAHPHRDGYKARYGILLDMVGGIGARFYQEGYSRHYAPSVVSRVWRAAATAGYASYFPPMNGGTVTDDHVPVNEVAGIPCIDIIPHYPDCEQSSFGPTWHTMDDDMQHIDRNTLKAVGQTVVQVLFTE